LLDDPKFVIKPIPGKGMGVVAIGPIAKGEVVLSEAPLFTQQLGWNMWTIVQSLVHKTADEKCQFLELTNCHQGKLLLYMGIFKTNTLPCGNNDRGERASKGGLFLQGSRFNSSCVPNVNNYWNERRQVIKFRALKAIAEGDELCIAYTTELKSRANRQTELWGNFGFECHCAACSLLGDELHASNHRRTTLDRLYDEIRQCANRPAVGIQKVCSALIKACNIVSLSFLLED
jgi:SET domain